MDTRVVLSDDMLARCRQYGLDMIECLRNDSRSAGSRAVSSHGAENDALLQAKAKMGEVAFAAWAGVMHQVKWKPGTPDNGFDVTLSGYRIDVKTIDVSKHLLLWPVNKNGFYLDKRFYGLVLVKASAPDFWITKWIDKAGFYSLHRISNGSDGLTPGTWNMHEDDLWPLQHLCDITRCRRGESAA